MDLGFGIRITGGLLLGLLALDRNTAHAAIFITPEIQSVCSGDTAEFTADVTDGTPPYSFSWSGPNYYSNSQTISVGTVGNYSVTVFNGDGSVFGSACATLNLKERPSVTTQGGTLTCGAEQIRIFASTSASNAVFSWSGPGIVSEGDTASPLVNLPGTYAVTVTSLNGCSSSTNAVVTEDRQAPQLTVLEPEMLTCTKTQVLLSASSTNQYARFNWSGPGIISGANSNTCVVNQPGIYTVTVSSPFFAAGIMAQGNITFNGSGGLNTFDSTNFYGSYYSLYTNRLGPWINETNFIIGDPGIYIGDQGTYYGGDLNAPLEDTNDIYGSGSSYGFYDGIYGEVYGGINIGSTPQCYSTPMAVIIDPNGTSRQVWNFYPWIFNTIRLNGHFQFHYDSALSSYGNGCVSTATVLVVQNVLPSTESAPEDLGQQFVSFGQGFWANGKGNLNGVRSADLIKLLLINPTNQNSDALIIGKPGRSLSIPLDAAEWLHTRLPAITSPGPLPSFGDQVLSAATGQTSPTLPTHKNGKIQNNLLGHVISLALNLRLDESLLDFALSLEFCTVKALSGPDDLIGTADDSLDLLGGAQRFTIPPSIFDALCSSGLPSNAAGLLELGNRALSGQSPHPATYDELASAIEMLNEAFDSGRFCVVCE
ncbi:MAG: hypothetical protein H0X66_19535 [Verrucomicrobia bacterium]|nr:hypothetical protein [Verrucomicrobiota bacterium]